MKKQEIDHILTQMLDFRQNVSDLNFTAGRPPQVESDGKLMGVPMDPPLTALTPYQTEILALTLMGRNRRIARQLARDGSCDLSYSLPGKARFRVNIFSQSGGNYSTVLRKLEARIPSIDMLGLPEVFHKIAAEKNGLIFVTGATGSGKSTSLAAMLDAINNTQQVHVVTLEDPVEYQHPQKKSTFNQREMGVDFPDYGTGLRAALRQAPKVILVGEMRDRDSVEIGIRAAETGHLVLTTLHTVDAGKTINRIIGMFENEEEKQMRIRLADSVKWIVCQRLLPRIGGGRVPAFEILGTSLRVKEIIMNGESDGKTFYEMIQTGRHRGMCTFDDSIIQLYEKGLITESTALSYASRREAVGRGLDQIKAARGETTTDIDNLEIDRNYGRQREGF